MGRGRGKLGELQLVISVRNHGMSGENAGEAVKTLFGEIGSAGGHRNMAKAVIPLRAWRRREGTTRDSLIEPRLRELFSTVIKAQKVQAGRSDRARPQWQLTLLARPVQSGVYRFCRFPYRWFYP